MAIGVQEMAECQNSFGMDPEQANVAERPQDFEI
jgi:hypothetical protein